MLNNNKSFLDLGLKNDFIKKLNSMGYVTPFPIQIECIPKLIDGFDILGVAQTGSGKTIAFVVPFLNKINVKKRIPQVLIIEPTRELVIQISKVAFNIVNEIKKINIISLYGGNNYNLEISNLKKGCHLVIGTPGRLLDHINKGTLILSEIKGLVLDEADEMLKMGFINDIKKILSKIPSNRQTALFSATMPKEIRNISYKFMNSPKEIKIDDIKNKPNIKQNYFIANNFNKNEALIRFIEILKFDLCIIFTNTKNSTLNIFNLLRKFRYNVSYINGDLSQPIREKTIDLFEKKKINILIATDIVSRGLDINDINLIINYDSPYDLDTYIHRIGRTGRAGNYGQSILFLKKNEFRLLKNIKFKFNEISELNLPNIDIINEIKLNKFKDKIKEYFLNKKYIRYNKFIPDLLSCVNNDIEKLLSIILSIYQESKPLIFIDKILNDIDIGINNKGTNIINKNINNSYDLFKINLGLINLISKKNILNFLIDKLKINHKFIGIIKIYNNFSKIQILKNKMNKELKFNTIKISNEFKKIKLIKI